MSDAVETAKVEYREFDFAAFITILSKNQQTVSETIFDEEDTYADTYQRAEAIVFLTQKAMERLEVEGYIGCDATIGKGAMLPPASLLQSFGIEPSQKPEESDDGGNTLDHDHTIAPTLGAASGTYEGVMVVQESLPIEGIISVRARIFHKILLESDEIQDMYVNQSTQLYGYQAIENGEIQIIKPGISHSPHEEWLRSAAKALFEPSEIGLNYQGLEDAFQRILNADESRGSVQKNLDWFYDHIEQVVHSKGVNIHLLTGGFLTRTASGKNIYTFGEDYVDGTVLGFGSMSTYKKNPETHEATEFEDERQLAILVQSRHRGEDCIISAPVALCPQFKDEEEV